MDNFEERKDLLIKLFLISCVILFIYSVLKIFNYSTWLFFLVGDIICVVGHFVQTKQYINQFNINNLTNKNELNC